MKNFKKFAAFVLALCMLFSLSGDYIGCRECHITPDWLLIYEIKNDELVLCLTRTGTHSDLF